MFDQLKKLLKQTSIYGIGAVISPIISFIMLPIYTRYLSPDDYGLLALTGVVGIFITKLFSLGLSSGLVRIYYTYKDEKDKEAVIGSSIIFGILFSSAVVLILYLLSSELGRILFDVPEGPAYFQLLIFTFLISNTNTKLNSIMRVEERAGIYTTIKVATLVITLSLNILFVVVLERKVMGILEAGLISAGIAFLMMVPFTLMNKKLRFSFNKLKEILAFGLPLIPAGIADTILDLSDRYFLEHYTTLTLVGLYSIGYRLAAMLSVVVIQPFNIAWPPYMFSIVDKPDAKRIYAKVLVYYLYFSAFIGLALSIFAKEALVIIATPEYVPAYSIVPLIVVTYILIGMMSILVAGIHITKKTKYVTIFFIISGLINLLLNYLLIPIINIWGAAISTLVSYGVLNICYFIFSQKLYPINHEFNRLIKISATAIILYLCSLLVTTGNSVLAVIFKLPIWMAFPLILYLLKFYKIEEIDKLKNIYRNKIVNVFTKKR